MRRRVCFRREREREYKFSGTEIPKRWSKRKRRRRREERLIESLIAGANRLASLKGPRLEMNGMTFKRGRVPPGIRHHRGSLPENESYFTVGAARDATGPSERGRRDADVREKVTKEATVLIIGVRAPYNADKGRRPGSAARDAIRRFCFFYRRLDRVLSQVGSEPTLSPRTPTTFSAPNLPFPSTEIFSPFSKNSLLENAKHGRETRKVEIIRSRSRDRCERRTKRASEFTRRIDFFRRNSGG